jgi:hypothetical protein
LVGAHALERAQGHALAGAQPRHELAVVHRLLAEGGFGEVVLAAEGLDLGQDGFHVAHGVHQAAPLDFPKFFIDAINGLYPISQGGVQPRSERPRPTGRRRRAERRGG